MTEINLSHKLAREIIHAKSIVKGKLYSTQTAEIMTGYRDAGNVGRILFRTEKGNYFSAQLDSQWVYKIGGTESIQVHKSTYFDIRPETETVARDLKM